MKKVLLAVFLMILAIGALAGCGQEKTGAKDQMVVGVGFGGETADPANSYDGWYLIEEGVGETLTKFDNEMKLVPWIAKSWSVSEDHKTWTFVIKDGVKFSNGQPVTAAAVKASLERSFQKNKRAEGYFTYSAIDADGQTLVIHTNSLDPDVPGYLADPMFVIVDTQGEAGKRNVEKDGPITTGPYQLESFGSDKVVVKRNENYWNGKVAMSQITFKLIPDGNTRAMALESGEIDVAANLGPDQLTKFRKGDFRVSEITSTRTEYGMLNQHGFLGDPMVRAAVISATNTPVYVKDYLNEAYTVALGPIPPALTFGYDQLTNPNSYDMDRAAKLLEQAGWKKNDKGILEKDGKPLTLRLVTYKTRPSLPIIAEAMQADLKKLGIDMTIQFVETKATDRMLEEGDYDIMLFSSNAAPSGDPAPFLSWYWHSNINGSTPFNATGYSNPIVDESLDTIKTTFSLEKRAQLVQAVQQQLLTDGAGLFLDYPKMNFAMHRSVQGLEAHPVEFYMITNEVHK